MKTKKILSGVAIAAMLTASIAETRAAAPTTVKHPDWAPQAVIYEVNTRQFSDDGSFKSVDANLDRLKDLGVDILWFMPIHPISEKNRKGGLGSYYSVKDYKAVNPEFGTLDDFKTLVDNAHARGMKVILDWVPIIPAVTMRGLQNTLTITPAMRKAKCSARLIGLTYINLIIQIPERVRQ